MYCGGNEQMGDIGKLKLGKALKKVGRVAKKVVKTVAPFVPAAAGIAITGSILKGRKAKKAAKKQAAIQAAAQQAASIAPSISPDVASSVASAMNSGSSGAAAELAVASQRTGFAPEVLAAATMQAAQPAQFTQPAQSMYSPTDPGGSFQQQAIAEGAEGGMSQATKIGIGVAAVVGLYLLTKKR